MLVRSGIARDELEWPHVRPKLVTLNVPKIQTENLFVPRACNVYVHNTAANVKSTVRSSEMENVAGPITN